MKFYRFGTAALILTAAVCLIGCQNMNRSQWGALAGTATGAAAGAALGGDEHRLEGALIGAAAGGGGGYLIGSQLDKRHQRRVKQEYNRLLKMNQMSQVDARITQVADRVLGNGDGFASAQEKNKALRELRNALDTAADQAGDTDGNTTSYERNNYVKTYQNRPLIKRLQQGY